MTFRMLGGRPDSGWVDFFDSSDQSCHCPVSHYGNSDRMYISFDVREACDFVALTLWEQVSNKIPAKADKETCCIEGVHALMCGGSEKTGRLSAVRAALRRSQILNHPASTTERHKTATTGCFNRIRPRCVKNAAIAVCTEETL